MINVVTEFGTSFKGLAAYLLHDEGRAVTSERVAWTHSHNLATDDPEQAWRVMAATAMSQTELKAAAGINNTGRKSNRTVMHYVLSWAEGERGEYSMEEMIDAALASMAYIGVRQGERIGKNRVAKRTQYADEHQALIVCHEEGPDKQPHVHVMLNRVHPVHGVMVSDSKDFEKLSAWALDYRRSQGKEHLCPARVKNAAKRAQGLLVSHPRKARNVYERDQEIERLEPGSEKKAQLEQQAQRARELTARSSQLRRDRVKATRALEDRHMQAERTERATTAERIRQSKSAIKTAYTPRIDAITERQAAEMRAFREAKETAAGRVRNTWEAFKTKEWMTDIRSNPVGAMKHAFGLAFSSGLQERDITRHHEREQSALKGEREAEERAAAREARAEERDRLEDLRTNYAQERNDLILEQRMGKAKLRAEWHQLDRDRLATTAEGGRSPEAGHRSAEPSQVTRVASQEQPQSLTQQFETHASEKRHTEHRYNIPMDDLRKMAGELRDQQNEAAQQDRGKDDPDQGISR